MHYKVKAAAQKMVEMKVISAIFAVLKQRFFHTLLASLNLGSIAIQMKDFLRKTEISVMLRIKQAFIYPNIARYFDGKVCYFNTYPIFTGSPLFCLR